MENASKALIIAGAILISIVLITLGVLIIGQGQDVVNQSNIDDQVVSAWNEKFTQYVGQDVTGTNVNKIINLAISTNAASNNKGEYSKLITLNGAGVSAPAFTSNTKAKDNSTTYTSACTTYAKPTIKYNVTCTYGSDGYVTSITFTGK